LFFSSGSTRADCFDFHDCDGIDQDRDGAISAHGEKFLRTSIEARVLTSSVENISKKYISAARAGPLTLCALRDVVLAPQLHCRCSGNGIQIPRAKNSGRLRRSFEIKPGEAAVSSGRNGTGKSTLLNC